MYNIHSFIFWYKFVFLLEIFSAFWLTSYTLKKRNHFRVRFLLSFLFLSCITFAFPMPFNNALYTTVVFMSIFIILLITAYFCLNETVTNILFCGIIAYTTQHLAYSSFNYFITSTGLGNFGFFYKGDKSVDSLIVLMVMAYITIYALLYWIEWALISNRIRYQEDLSIGGNSSLFFLCSAVIVVDIIINAVLIYNVKIVLPTVVYTVNYIQTILCCILVLGMQFSMLGKQIAEDEVLRINQLWKIDKKSYELFKQNVEIINIKCHDLKHQLKELRLKEGEVDKESLKEIEHAINIYSCKFQTGNNIVDTILAEKTIQCEHEKIEMMCIIDGKALDFLKANELYTIFGNLLSNAIEAVKLITQEDKKVISLNVTRRQNMIVIHEENYCANAEQIHFENGLPVTTKGDKNYHGFGIRSIELVAERYDGSVDVHIENHIFMLNILLNIKN